MLYKNKISTTMSDRRDEERLKLQGTVKFLK